MLSRGSGLYEGVSVLHDGDPSNTIASSPSSVSRQPTINLCLSQPTFGRLDTRRCLYILPNSNILPTLLRCLYICSREDTPQSHAESREKLITLTEDV